MNMEERPVDIMTVTDELTKMVLFQKVASWLPDGHLAGFGCHIEHHGPNPGAEIFAATAIDYAGYIETLGV